MAEFCEVMKQARRMCEADGSGCHECDAHKNRCCLYYCLPKEYETQKLQEFERIVMDWAAAHPEPRYPTWQEWQEATFPDGVRKICLLDVTGREACSEWNHCAECRAEPIPADIAEKLGVKPIGGGDR